MQPERVALAQLLFRPQNLRPETTETARGHVRGAAGWLDGPSSEEMRPDDTFRLSRCRLSAAVATGRWSETACPSVPVCRPPMAIMLYNTRPRSMDDEISSTPALPCRDAPNGPS